jgi:formylglycine-generating enzyme required for sulfatase activity
MACVPGGSFVDATDGFGLSHDVETLFFDIEEVTMLDYTYCVYAGMCSPPDTSLSGGLCNWQLEGKADQAMNCVDFFDAGAYCAYAGKRLPDMWEWEWAARGGDEARLYPWGAEAPGDRACWKGSTPPAAEMCNVGSTSPAGDSRHGLKDMAGNAAEWTDSTIDGPTPGVNYRVLRGGAWSFDAATNLETNARLGFDEELGTAAMGFRCVVPPETP